MKVAVVLPRGMHFSPKGATSIDIVARDLMLASRHRGTSYIIGQEVDAPFDDLDFRSISFSSQKDAARAIVDKLKQDLPDVIVVHQHPETAAHVARALPQVPTVLHRHGLLKVKSNPVARWFKKRQFTPFKKIIFVSDFIRQSFLVQYPTLASKTEVVFNGVDTDFWAPAATKTKDIVFVGRAREDKGLFPLLEAFNSLKEATESGAGDESADWRLKLILGVQTDTEKALEADIRAACAGSDKIDILTNEPSERVRDHLASASIAALPSIVREGFGRVIVEAMACGCVTLATKQGGAIESGGEAALLLDTPTAPDFTQRLTQTLADLIQDEQKLQQHFRLGREHVIQNFTLSAVAQHYDSVLEDLAR